MQHILGLNYFLLLLFNSKKAILFGSVTPQTLWTVYAHEVDVIKHLLHKNLKNRVEFKYGQYCTILKGSVIDNFLCWPMFTFLVLQILQVFSRFFPLE